MLFFFLAFTSRGFLEFCICLVPFLKIEDKEVNSRNVSSGRPLFLRGCVVGREGVCPHSGPAQSGDVRETLALASLHLESPILTTKLSAMKETPLSRVWAHTADVNESDKQKSGFLDLLKEAGSSSCRWTGSRATSLGDGHK